MVLTKKISSRILIVVVLSLSGGIFIIDLQTPLGIADGFSYLAVMLLSLWTNDKKITIISALTGIILIIAGYFFSPTATPTSEPIIAITNRLVSILIVIICAFLIIKFKRMEEEVINHHSELQVLSTNLQTTNIALEERVKERTRVLENALNELKTSEMELQKSLEKEKELNELKSRFVSMASHEFRTPLATILSSISLVSSYSKQNEKDKLPKHIDRIKSAVVHLTDLLTDILSLTKLEEGKINVSLEKFMIKDFVSQIIAEMQAIAKVNQNIDYNHNGDDEIVLDKKILRNIMLNLISNAIKFSSENVKVNSEADGAVFTMVVEDSGIGIPEEDQKYLFERFFRGTNASDIQGTGLGLNIVERYVEILNGKINFISGANKGTRFTIKCPIDNNTIFLNNHSLKETA